MLQVRATGINQPTTLQRCQQLDYTASNRRINDEYKENTKWKEPVLTHRVTLLEFAWKYRANP
jgi:hypothetical protein